MKCLASFALAILLVGVPALAGDKSDPTKIGERKVGGGINLYSLEAEVRLGKMLAQQVEQSARLVDDPEISAYVNKLAQTLVRNSDARVPFSVKVIDSSQVNAFALPGGFFFINTGLIALAEEEAELAGVMAHEIAHVTARHSTKRATKAQLVQWAMIPIQILSPVGWAGWGIYQGLSYGLPLTFLKFSRDAERDADYLGLQYMWKAGYDPTALITFFERLQESKRKDPGSVPLVFSSHPPTKERIRRAQEEIAELLPAREQYVVTTSEFDRIKNKIQALHQKRKVSKPDSSKPTLRRKGERPSTDEGGSEDEKPPVLKRRP